MPKIQDHDSSIGNRAVRIALWSTGYLRGIGGSERMVNALIGELDAAGLHTTLIADAPSGMARDNPYLPSLPSAVRVHADTFPNPILRLGSAGQFSRAVLQYAAASLRLLRFFARERPQIVHQHLVSLDIFLLILCKYLFGYRLIVTFRGVDIAAAEHSRLARLKVRSTVRFADATTGVSHQITERLRDRYGSTDAMWIANGVDARDVRRAREVSEPVIEADHFVYCGRLHAVKRIPFLVDLFHRAIQHGCDRNLYIIGEGEDLPAIERSISRYGLADRILLVGALRHDRALAAIVNARGLLLCSLTEGCPNVVLEAQALGVPVIATNVGGVPDLIIHGETGYMFAPDDARAATDYLLRLSNDPGHARTLGRRGARRVEAEFSIAIMVERYTALYQSLMSGASTSQYLEERAA